MEKGFAPIILLVVILTGALAAGGGYYFLTQKNQTPQQSVTTISTPVPTVQPTSDPTANWKTYTNQEQGYSIKYPDTWFIGKDGLFDGNVIGSIKATPMEERGTSVLRIEIHSGNLSYSRYAYFYHLSPKAEPKSLGQITIDEHIWEKFSDNNDLSINNNLYVLATTYNGKKYFLVKRTDLQSKNFQNDSGLIEEMIKTFKFTNETTSPTPTCMPRPKCLDSTPRCLIPEPAEGWCKPTPFK